MICHTYAVTAGNLNAQAGFSREDCAKLATTTTEKAVRCRESPTAGASTMHGGMDLCLDDEKGNSITFGAPVRAARDGKVIVSQGSDSYGNYVQIEHEDGFSTLYAHNSQLCVNVGDTVKQGQIIAYAGSTGVSTGPHCHFEVRNPDGVRLDPLNYLPLDVK